MFPFLRLRCRELVRKPPYDQLKPLPVKGMRTRKSRVGQLTRRQRGAKELKWVSGNPGHFTFPQVPFAVVLVMDQYSTNDLRFGEEQESPDLIAFIATCA